MTDNRMERVMDHFYVITNPAKDADLKVTYFIRDYLIKQGKTCVIDTGGDNKKQDGYTDRSKVDDKTECVIVLGGDGTLLQAASDLVDMEIPFLGINLGTLGFLAEVSVSETASALDRLIRDEYEIENRMMLYGTGPAGTSWQDEARALNDIVITRKGSLQIINFNIYVNGQFLHRYHADGVIVATPTGSTGYSLSAGGPIVEPRANLILVSPICPHSMQSRSIVLSPEDRVMIELEPGHGEEGQQVEAIFDGSHKIALRAGDKVEIKKSRKTTGIIKLSQMSFVEALHQKMSD
ncbi:MAG: NAD(+)/NADH kinase [Lachnospiraceae bacterium]|nr:NAD(+)/NADH kinase [Lachnospiraceae bacterium]